MKRTGKQNEDPHPNIEKFSPQNLQEKPVRVCKNDEMTGAIVLMGQGLNFSSV